ncbi:hypothetical protein BH24CHL7_BH24CHL7_08860 [soil metagenome]
MEELEERRREAVAAFIAQRGMEGGARYRDASAANRVLVRALFDATDDLLDFASGAALAAAPQLLAVARYLGGPPISGDDLDTLAETRIASRRRLDADLGRKAASVIAASIDPERFPWLYEDPSRRPTEAERDTAVRWTAGLKAVQEIAMGRRSESSARQEASVRSLLERHGFSEVRARPIDVTGAGLAPGQFSREALVVGTRADVPVGLRDGRLLLIECKVSNSAVNSVKRLNRETGGKAQQWRRELGARAIPAAVLAGVFGLSNLIAAQESGVTIFWEHDLRVLEAFLTEAS